jgi:hypothetical protein
LNPVPATLAQEITDAMNALVRESDRFRDPSNPIVLEIFERIKKLQKANAQQAFVRFGFLAALCGDVGGVRENHRKALYLPDKENTQHEFWVSMGNVGLYGEAQEIGTWLLEPKRGFFSKVWERAICMGQILAVWNRISEAQRLYPEELRDADFSLVEHAVAVMRERGLTDEKIALVFDLQGEVQRSHKLAYSGRLGSVLKVIRPPEEPPYLYFALPLTASVSEVHAMNRGLARLVVEKAPDGAFPPGLVATFAKAPPTELRAAA